MNTKLNFETQSKKKKIENLVFHLFSPVFLVLIWQTYFSSQKLSILAK